MSRSFDVVVIGAGSAGFSAVHAAREKSNTSTLLLVNEEEIPPYDRTLLSKMLTGRNGDGIVPLTTDSWFEEQRIQRVDGVYAGSINREDRTVLVGGEAVSYGALVLTTGAEPIFPKLVRHHERGSFFVVRNAGDLKELKDQANKAKTALVAGMGVLAVEVAHQLVQMGKRVTLAGATPQLMPRQLSARAGELLEEAMATKTLKMLFQEEIISFEQNKKHSWSVEMLKHSAHYDMVIFCIGVTPRTQLAEEAGLSVGQGIKVDESLRTDDPAILAAGDCAELPDGRISYLWEEAAAQGAVAGANAVGGDLTYGHHSFPLRTSVFGMDIYSIGKPRKPWEYRIEEFEIGNRYYAYYWSNEEILRGAVILNDPEFSGTVDTAVRENWDRAALDAVRKS
jgi:NAD(P)H-nitrite reductase large subunit